MLNHPHLPDTFIVDGHIVACDGGGAALGHPKIYLEIHDNGEVACPYCSRRFIHK